MQNGRKTSMNKRQPRPAAPFVGRRWSSNVVRPEQNGSQSPSGKFGFIARHLRQVA